MPNAISAAPASLWRRYGEPAAKAHGVFDWKKSKRRKSAVFTWNGDEYETEDEDPVIDYGQ